MLHDSIQFFDNSDVNNMQIKSGAVLPDGQIGELFYLDTGDIGLYVYDGTDWGKLGAGVIPTITVGSLFSWGENNVGQLGDGTIIKKSSPIQVGSLTTWNNLSTVGVFCRNSFGIQENGTLWAWGENDSYSLGLGDIVKRSSPVQVGSETNWQSINGGTYFTGAIKTDGTLWTWGKNNTGQLGQQNVVTYSVPTKVGTLTNWQQFVGSYSSAGAIKTDGTLWTWGQNFAGQLGSNNSNESFLRSSPAQIGALTDWKQLSTSIHFYTAIKTDGTLWSWGYNDFGQLGLNHLNNISSPVQIGSLTNWKQVSCGTSYALAVKTDGTLWAWGDGTQGKLGTGDTISKSSPVQIGMLTNWKEVFTTNETSLAIKTDGTLWAWGLGTTGQLGDGTIIKKSSPIQVGSLTTWKTVGLGSDQILAIKL